MAIDTDRIFRSQISESVLGQPSKRQTPSAQTAPETNPVLQLLAEHVAFRAVCEELTCLIERLEGQGRLASISIADYATLLKTRETIREHLNVHLVKEEEVFFPRLEKLIPQGRVKFLFLNYDHEYLRDYFEAFCNAISDYEHERAAMHLTVERIIASGKLITVNLVQHILAEDTVYFQLAEEEFSAEELLAIGAEMNALENRLRERQ